MANSFWFALEWNHFFEQSVAITNGCLISLDPSIACHLTCQSTNNPWVYSLQSDLGQQPHEYIHPNYKEVRN
jgi:hypothetical protein